MPKETGFHEAMAVALAGISPRAVTLDVTGSTNDDARALARDGAAHLSVVVADEQTAGRGRRDRSWHAAPGESLLASWVVRPPLPPDRWTVLPLLTGVAVRDAIEERSRVAADLKWPNDVLVEGRKLAGILAEAEPPSFAVIGVGVNVSQLVWPDDLSATSLALEGGIRLDRADLLAHILRRFDEALAAPEQGMERYRARCATIGRRVRVQRTDGPPLTGVAEAVDDRGALIVDGRVVTAGDVVHVR